MFVYGVRVGWGSVLRAVGVDRALLWAWGRSPLADCFPSCGEGVGLGQE